MTVSTDQTTSGRHRLATSHTSSASSSTASPRLPKPIPETPKPWMWRCLCNTTNPVFKPRCLYCGRKIKTHDETIAEFKVRLDKFRATNQQRQETKDTPVEDRKGPSIGILEGRLKQLKKKDVYRQDFDYRRWSVYQSWRMACEAHREMPEDDEEGMQTVAVKSARKEERKREFARLRREKKLERRDRMVHAAGHCERDCRWPGECAEVLRRILLEEEKDVGSLVSTEDKQEDQ